MKKSGMILVLSCMALASSGFAINVSFIAKSAQSGDTCYMTAKVVTLTETSGNAVSGVQFRAFSPDGDQLDVHCSNVVIKLKHNNEVFVSNLTAEDLNQCKFSKHNPESVVDTEVNTASSSKFVAIEPNGTTHR